ncbi:MAG: NAD(P)(+) transhydrogenase (Re/Si-specific) subunit beta [Holosporaceae bacterium]|jgi:NAD(P) transhydrogenase subunit beta|nr:NAD(P)(+) transhydrogenase (Re/Si-specific) subunit beta [Holosporaceae bacterium]
MIDLLYLMSSICFVLALKGLSSADSSCAGNLCGMSGMGIALLAAYLGKQTGNGHLIFWAVVVGGAVGLSIARKVSMTDLPQMIAGFHSLVGLAAVLIACTVYAAPDQFGIDASPDGGWFWRVEMGIGAAIGAITFSGSVIAFLKLQSSYKWYHVHPALNVFITVLLLCSLAGFVLLKNSYSFSLAVLTSFALGTALIMPIGGADMPVIVSLLNSCSGWAAAGIGFTLHNDLLIITGALVGASGAILSRIMCRSMNRTLGNVIFGSCHGSLQKNTDRKDQSFTHGAPEEAAFLLKNATSVIVVPGYGMATSHAQHALREMGEALKKRGISVRYAIHPVAGRMPGHMNVLLAEANVPYEDVFSLDDINREFPSCDVAYVVGANDITNPAAKKDELCAIYGMPILEVEKAKVVLFLKRSMGTGYTGVDNELFYAPNTMMLLGDARETTEAILKVL